MTERTRIESRQELISLIFRLLDENDAIEWENETAYSFLQALAAWLNDADSFYLNINESRDPNNASWQLFADALQAAAVYE
jgi:hypothetical protein